MRHHALAGVAAVGRLTVPGDRASLLETHDPVLRREAARPRRPSTRRAGVRARHSASTPGLSNVTRPRASSGSLTWVVLGAYAHPKSHFTCRGRGQMSAHHTPEEIRKDLTHPVIDGDGHWVEYTPVFAEQIRKVTGDLGANGFLQSQRRIPDSLSMTLEQRTERGAAMEGFWGRQSTNTRDRATAMMPRMLYDRLGELGIDFGIVYPTAGLGIPRIADDATRRAVIRGFNVVTHEYFKDLGDKLTPAAPPRQRRPRRPRPLCPELRSAGTRQRL